MNTSEKIDTIAAALYAVQRDLELPKKDTRGQVRGKSDYRYLGLPGLIDHCRKALRDAQVQVMQQVTGGPGFVEVTTLFMHLNGQWIELGPLFLPAAGDAQAYGSAITYARRYALAAALNLAADEDDDAAPPVRATGGARPTPGGPAVGSGEPAAVTVTAAAGSPVTDADADAGSLADAAIQRLKDTVAGRDQPATDEQWERLRALVGGSQTKAVNRLNKANQTRYTAATAKAGATFAELVAAIAEE